MQPIPTPTLVVIEATFAFGVLIALLDGPAAVGQLDQPLPRRVRRQVTVIPFDLAAGARQRPLAEPSPLRTDADTMMTGGELRAPCRPVSPHGHELFAQDHVVVLAPGDALPAVLWQGIEHSLGRVERCRAGLLGVATPPWSRWGHARCGAAGDTLAAAQTSAGCRTPQGLLTPTT